MTRLVLTYLQILKWNSLDENLTPPHSLNTVSHPMSTTHSTQPPPQETYYPRGFNPAHCCARLLSHPDTRWFPTLWFSVQCFNAPSKMGLCAKCARNLSYYLFPNPDIPLSDDLRREVSNWHGCVFESPASIPAHSPIPGSAFSVSSTFRPAEVSSIIWIPDFPLPLLPLIPVGSG